MTAEVRILPSEERDQLMKEVSFHVAVPAEQGLAMKADFCLPWRKLRMIRRYSYENNLTLFSNITRRWMKSWGINIASEAKQRSLMKDQLSNLPVKSKSVPFAFNFKRGGQELRPAPLARTLNIWSQWFFIYWMRNKGCKCIFDS